MDATFAESRTAFWIVNTWREHVYSIRGISISNKSPGNKGLGMAVTGLILSILGTLGMIGVLALIALANSGALGQ
ncbi:MAG TPA: hypothetical protein VF120_06135 [Ktedonobacterales bacterium]